MFVSQSLAFAKVDFLRTYVLTIRGGNEQAMENDQSFAYNTLKRLGVKERNFFNIAAYPDQYRKGIEELLNGQGVELFKSSRRNFVQRFDLDKNGRVDLHEDLGHKNIIKGLKILAEKDYNDQGPSQLFIHLAAHGNVDNKLGGYVLLANSLDQPRLYATQLAQWINDYVPQNTLVVIFVHACYSGSFSSLQNGPNRLVITSADESHVAWMGCVDGQVCSYFDRNFFSALGGINGVGKKVNADVNDDGVVSLREAYQWSKDGYPHIVIKIEQIPGVKFDHNKFFNENNLGLYSNPDSWNATKRGNFINFFFNPAPTEFVIHEGDLPQFYSEPNQDVVLGDPEIINS